MKPYGIWHFLTVLAAALGSYGSTLRSLEFLCSLQYLFLPTLVVSQNYSPFFFTRIAPNCLLRPFLSRMLLLVTIERWSCPCFFLSVFASVEMELSGLIDESECYRIAPQRSTSLFCGQLLTFYYMWNSHHVTGRKKKDVHMLSFDPFGDGTNLFEHLFLLQKILTGSMHPARQMRALSP